MTHERELKATPVASGPTVEQGMACGLSDEQAREVIAALKAWKEWQAAKLADRGQR